MKHIRITFNSLAFPTPENFLVEYGRMEVVGLTAEERLEYDELGKKFEDAPKADFAKAADLLDPKKLAEIQGRRRYAELDKKLIEPQMIWMPVDVEDTLDDCGVHTILLIMQEGRLPIYVENMPEEMIKRLMEPQIHIHSPQVFMTQIEPTTTKPPATVSPKVETGSNPMERITAALKAIKEPNSHGKPWEELVNLDAKNPAEGIWANQVTAEGRLYILAMKFLGTDWKKMNDTINAVFGTDKVIWHRDLKAQSHWEVVLA